MPPSPRFYHPPPDQVHKNCHPDDHLAVGLSPSRCEPDFFDPTVSAPMPEPGEKQQHQAKASIPAGMPSACQPPPAPVSLAHLPPGGKAERAAELQAVLRPPDSSRKPSRLSWGQLATTLDMDSGRGPLSASPPELPEEKVSLCVCNSAALAPWGGALDFLKTKIRHCNEAAQCAYLL